MRAFLRPVPTFLVATLAIASAPSPSVAQTMEQALRRLFVFGEGDRELYLVGSGSVPSTQIHGNHFIPAQAEANAALLDFFGRTIAKSVSSFPIPTTTTSETYVFVGGVPTPTSNSFGPISAERALTIGKGRMNAGLSYTRLRFSELRGVDLGNLRFSFVHENVDFEGCDEIFQADCTRFGTPAVENDLIDLALDVDIAAEVFALYATYGLTDWLDLSVAVPIVDLELDGTARAEIRVAGTEAVHFFGGTPENPVLGSSSFVRERTSGIGDVAVRLKARVSSSQQWQFAALGELRVPAGREEDFLGTGAWNAKTLLIFSGDLGTFSPHGNLGFEYRGSDVDENELKAVLGFDQRLADWASFAIDILGAFKVGDPVLTLPAPVTWDDPFRRTQRLSNVPDRRDDVVEGAVGFKFRANRGLFLISNVLVPLNEGGLRSGPAFTLALEVSR